MVLLADLARKHRIKKGTLSVRLWEARIEASSYRMVRGRACKEYDSAACKQVAKLLKEHPVRRKAARKTTRRKS